MVGDQVDQLRLGRILFDQQRQTGEQGRDRSSLLSCLRHRVVSDADCQGLAHWGSLFVPSIPQDASARRERNFVTVNQDILATVESMERQIVQRAVRNDDEFPFAALRLRTDAAKRYKRVDRATAVIWKILIVAERPFRRFTAPELMRDVHNGFRYVDGIPATTVTEEVAA